VGYFLLQYHNQAATLYFTKLSGWSGEPVAKHQCGGYPTHFLSLGKQIYQSLSVGLSTGCNTADTLSPLTYNNTLTNMTNQWITSVSTIFQCGHHHLGSDTRRCVFSSLAITNHTLFPHVCLTWWFQCVTQLSCWNITTSQAHTKFVTYCELYNGYTLTQF